MLKLNHSSHNTELMYPQNKATKSKVSLENLT